MYLGVAVWLGALTAYLTGRMRMFARFSAIRPMVSSRGWVRGSSRASEQVPAHDNVDANAVSEETRLMAVCLKLNREVTTCPPSVASEIIALRLCCTEIG